MPDGSCFHLADDIIVVLIGVHKFAVGFTDILALIFSQRLHGRDKPKGGVASFYIKAQLHIDIVSDGVGIGLMVFRISIDTRQYQGVCFLLGKKTAGHTCEYAQHYNFY